jgi:epoxyqueuosine reductase
MVRNAAIAAGNSGSAALVAPLRKLVKDDDPVVAEAAQWALDQLTKSRSSRAKSRGAGTDSSRAPLDYARDERVMEGASSAH